MNCSGKHAAMLATCVANGWPTDTYRDPDHPLQQAIAATFADLTGEPIAVTAVDGCGAPLFSASLVGLAHAFRRLALGETESGDADPDAARVADAIRALPGVRLRDDPRRAGAPDRHPRRDRQGGGGGAATPSLSATGGRSRSRPTTAPPACGPC